ncbi:MAG TPA: XRE family transcriptional regulator [Rhizomicrobium sp.]|nr:XRE family transcriptional regulator [Rhizomicrobium sp.]
MPKQKTARISFWADDPLSFGQGVATHRQTKLKLAYAINRTIKHRKLQRAATAGMLELAPKKIANLRSYNLRGFSVADLTGFLAALNRSAETGEHHRH